MMKKERSILELLIYLKDNIEKHWGEEKDIIEFHRGDLMTILKIGGLCIYINFLYFSNEISLSEAETIKEFMHDRKNELETERDGSYWWERGVLEPRIKARNKLIEIAKNEIRTEH